MLIEKYKQKFSRAPYVRGTISLTTPTYPFPYILSDYLYFFCRLKLFN
jgi:hypothetical protein